MWASYDDDAAPAYSAVYTTDFDALDMAVPELTMLPQSRLPDAVDVYVRAFDSAVLDGPDAVAADSVASDYYMPLSVAN